MSDRIDRRQVRTKQLLYHALLELIEEKGVEAVTVTDIATRADINRGTFYLHYQDVPDMLDRIKEDVFNQIEKNVIHLNFSEVKKYAGLDEPYPASVKVFEALADHADFLRIMFGSNGDLSYAIRFRNFLSTHIFNKINYLQDDPADYLIPRDYLIAYISSAHFGIVMHWLESGMKHSPYEMGKIMTQISNHGPIVSSQMRKK